MLRLYVGSVYDPQIIGHDVGGFYILDYFTAFPDCEVMRRVDLDLWRRVLIEFEYESRNFLAHMHPAADCDLIVCWIHKLEGVSGGGAGVEQAGQHSAGNALRRFAQMSADRQPADLS